MSLLSNKIDIIQCTCTILKSGVDLKKRFKKILDKYPDSNLSSDAAKEIIALELYKQVSRDFPDSFKEEIF